MELSGKATSPVKRRGSGRAERERARYNGSSFGMVVELCSSAFFITYFDNHHADPAKAISWLALFKKVAARSLQTEPSLINSAFALPVSFLANRAKEHRVRNRAVSSHVCRIRTASM